MLDGATIEADIDILHGDFGARDLVDAAGAPVKGFFLNHTLAQPADGDYASNSQLQLRSPVRYEAGSVIANAKTGASWLVAFVRGDDAAYTHDLRVREAAAA